MCFGINKYGQMVDVGIMGQYSDRLEKYDPDAPSMLPPLFNFGFLRKVNNGNSWNLHTPPIVNDGCYGNSNGHAPVAKTSWWPFGNWNV